MTYEEARCCCHVRAAIYRTSHPSKRFWKNHTVPLDMRVPPSWKDDMRERKPMLVTNQYLRGGEEWSPWRAPSVSEWYMRSDRFDRIRIQDLPPLPEPMETTDE